MPQAPAVLILAAGKGTRMGPPTPGSLPKVLREAAGKPLLRHVLDTSRLVRPREIVVVLSPELADPKGPHAAQLDEILSSARARRAVQRKPLGTADAVRAGLSGLRSRAGTVLILVGDAPLLQAQSLKKLLREHHSKRALASILSMRPPSPKGYGRLLRGAGARPLKIVEQKDLPAGQEPSAECNSGTWALDLRWLRRNIGRVGKKNAAGEFYLTDLFEWAAREGRAAAVELDRFEEGLGVNTLAQLLEAAAHLRRRGLTQLQAGGVMLVDPATTYIDTACRVGPGTLLGPHVMLQGASRVGKDCRIGAGSLIVDSVLADGVEILPYTLIEESRVERGARVGPLAHLRPGSVVGRGAHVGNFVELKKSRLGAGAKANHLSYLGDSDVGERANVGAGTITCNYDGKNKYKTRIGAGAFIGSDTQLVAPVRVGKGAYVAAGTTVTRNVPDGALAISRVAQVNKPRRRKKR